MRISGSINWSAVFISRAAATLFRALDFLLRPRIGMFGITPNPDRGIAGIQRDHGDEQNGKFHIPLNKPLNSFGKMKFQDSRKTGFLKKPDFGEKWLYTGGRTASFRAPVGTRDRSNHLPLYVMKVLSSLASAKRRHADCQIVKRKGTVYVICKSNPKFKARQGATAGTRLSKKGL